MSGYEHISILECNRASSVEGKSGNNENPALYRNKLGTGVKLGIGDQISVERAFISEVGSGADTIEFTGKNLGENFSFNYSVHTEYGEDNEKNNCMIKKPLLIARNTELTSTPIKDNVAYFKHSFYKTTNGEFTITLPRSFIPISDNCDFSSTDTAPSYNIAWEKGCGGNLNLADPNKILNSNDSNYKTRKFANDLNSCWNMRESTLNGAPQAWTYVGQRVESDYRKQDSTTTLLGPLDMSGNLTTDGVTGRFPMGEWDDGSAWKLRNDNSRYTLFTRQVNFRFYDKDQFVNDLAYGGNKKLSRQRMNDYMMDGKPERLDPCIRSYIKRTDAMKLEIPVGYNAPSNISDQISNQLNKSGNVEQQTFGENTGPSGERIAPIPSTFTQQGSLYKPVACASGVNFTETYYREFASVGTGVSVVVTTGVPTNEYQLDSRLQYLNSFETIGIKRADLWELGHILYPPTNVEFDQSVGEFGNWEIPQYNVNLTAAGAGQTIENKLFTCRNPMRSQGHFTATDLPIFESGIPYTPENCQKVKDLFDAQMKYPELFYIDGEKGYIGPSYDDDDVAQPTWKTDWWSKYTIDKCRFLHINSSDSVSRTNTMNNNWLGSDNYWDNDLVDFWTMDDWSTTKAATNTYNPNGNDDWQPRTESDAHFSTSLPNPDPLAPTFGWGPNLRRDQDVSTKGPRYNTGGAYNWASYPIFFYWDSSRSDIYSSSGGQLGTNDQLCYGSMQSSNGLDDGTGYIVFTQEPLHNTTAPWVRNTSTTGGQVVGEINSYIVPSLSQVLNFRCMGWDTHFNAYSTAAILPFNGIAPTNCPVNASQEPTEVTGNSGWRETYGGVADTQFYDIHSVKWYQTLHSTNTSTEFRPSPGEEQTPKGTIHNSVNKDNIGSVESNTIGFGYYNQLYVGANNPIFSFDESASRFSLSQLHTPEFTGQDFLAGKDAANPEIADADTPVYHINKVLKNNNWCVDMIPYNNWSATERTDPDKTQNIFYFNNPNMTADAIFDSMGGIFIEDFGISEDIWDQSFWGILGFSYKQFNQTIKPTFDSTTNSFGLENSQERFTQARINGNQSTFTTNALVSVKDQPNWSKNYWGSDMLMPQVTHQKSEVTATKQPQVTADFADGIREIPTVIVDALSTEFVASNLPRKMFRPYFTIRSDIITDPSWLGGPDSGQILPIVSIVSKQNADGDFFFQESPSDLVFTNTIPRTITDVSISIHDPSGQFARVDESTAILFKISKQIRSDQNVLSSILQGMSQKKQEQEMVNLGISPPQKIIL